MQRALRLLAAGHHCIHNVAAEESCRDRSLHRELDRFRGRSDGSSEKGTAAPQGASAIVEPVDKRDRIAAPTSAVGGPSMPA